MEGISWLKTAARTPLFAAREALIAEGNTAFNQQRDRPAMTHYQQALEVAQAILAEKPRLNTDYTARFEALNLFESALAALIVTFNNMTHLRLRQSPCAALSRTCIRPGSPSSR